MCQVLNGDGFPAAFQSFVSRTHLWATPGGVAVSHAPRCGSPLASQQQEMLNICNPNSITEKWLLDRWPAATTQFSGVKTFSRFFKKKLKQTASTRVSKPWRWSKVFKLGRRLLFDHMSFFTFYCVVTLRICIFVFSSDPLGQRSNVCNGRLFF